MVDPPDVEKGEATLSWEIFARGLRLMIEVFV